MRNKLKETLRSLLMQFFIITVCVMFVVAAVNTMAYGFYPMDSSFPWIMMLTGALGALPSLLLRFRREPTKRQFWLRVLLHFCCIEALILGEGFFLGWFSDIQHMAVVAAMISAVYVLVWVFDTIAEKNTAQSINKALTKYNEDETPPL